MGQTLTRGRSAPAFPRARRIRTGWDRGAGASGGVRGDVPVAIGFAWGRLAPRGGGAWRGDVNQRRAGGQPGLGVFVRKGKGLPRR